MSYIYLIKTRDELIENKISVATAIEKLYFWAKGNNYNDLEFFENEYYGYTERCGIPSFRIVSGEVYFKIFLEYGLEEEIEEKEKFLKIYVGEKISVLEKIIAKKRKYFYFEDHIQERINQCKNFIDSIEVGRLIFDQIRCGNVFKVKNESIAGILEDVRNCTLDQISQIEKKYFGLDFLNKSNEDIGNKEVSLVNYGTIKKLEVIQEMGDKYQAGQAGVMGPNATGNNFVLNQQNNQPQISLNFEEIIPLVQSLKDAVKGEVEDCDDKDIVIGQLAEAVQAGKEKDESKMKQRLASALALAKGFSVEVVSKIGAELVAKGVLAGF